MPYQTPKCPRIKKLIKEARGRAVAINTLGELDALGDIRNLSPEGCRDAIYSARLLLLEKFPEREIELLSAAVTPGVTPPSGSRIWVAVGEETE